MLREAELFVMAEQVLVEVLGRIGPADQDIVLPTVVGVAGADGASALRCVVDQYAADDAAVPDVLAGCVGKVEPPDIGQLRSDDRQAAIVRIADAASAAARGVSRGDAVLHALYGDATTCDYLLRLTVCRCLLAHYVAAYLGSTACPLPEELARPLWELTAPHAEAWRSTGIFRNPMPVPELASWRDTFLLSAGHAPHPLGH